MDVDELMSGTDDKENQANNHLAAHSQDLLDKYAEMKIVVTNNESGSRVPIESGQEAFYALLAQEMLELSQKYDRDAMEVHKVFYEVSCNMKALREFLEGNQVCRWTPLEDLALKKKDRRDPSYQYVLAEKG